MAWDAQRPDGTHLCLNGLTPRGCVGAILKLFDKCVRDPLVPDRAVQVAHRLREAGQHRLI